MTAGRRAAMLKQLGEGDIHHDIGAHFRICETRPSARCNGGAVVLRHGDPHGDPRRLRRRQPPRMAAR